MGSATASWGKIKRPPRSCSRRHKRRAVNRSSGYTGLTSNSPRWAPWTSSSSGPTTMGRWNWWLRHWTMSSCLTSPTESAGPGSDLGWVPDGGVWDHHEHVPVGAGGVYASGTACQVCHEHQILYQGKHFHIPTKENGAELILHFHKELKAIQYGSKAHNRMLRVQCCRLCQTTHSRDHTPVASTPVGPSPPYQWLTWSDMK